MEIFGSWSNDQFISIECVLTRVLQCFIFWGRSTIGVGPLQLGVTEHISCQNMGYNPSRSLLTFRFLKPLTVRSYGDLNNGKYYYYCYYYSYGKSRFFQCKPLQFCRLSNAHKILVFIRVNTLKLASSLTYSCSVDHLQYCFSCISYIYIFRLKQVMWLWAA